MHAPAFKIEIRVLGPLRVLRATGEDCTPVCKKTRALLGLLALAPDKRRARGWLQDRLWGTRGREQAAASLRQSLAEIRKAFGPARECLFADSALVGLDPDRVSVDYDACAGEGLAGVPVGVDLMEGLDIGHEDFADWLGEQRQRLAARRGLAAPGGVPTPALHLAAAPMGNTLVLTRSGACKAGQIGDMADSLVDNISKTVLENAAARIIDARFDEEGTQETVGISGPVLQLRSQIVHAGEGPQLRLVLVNMPGHELVWSKLIELPSRAAGGIPDILRARQVNEAAAVCIDHLASVRQAVPARMQAASLSQEAVRLLFRLGPDNFNRADDLFSTAFDMDRRGFYLAWRAYLRTFVLAEVPGACRKSLDEEAFSLLRRALELEPNNSYVLALGAHVYSMLRRSYVSAYEMAERSVQINPSNPIGWACLGTAKCYLGKSEEGFQNTVAARQIAGYAPCRYQMDALSCIAGTMAGKFEQAVHFGEASHILAPTFAAPMRYLTALYFHQGAEEQSAAMSEKLRCIEPDFSYRKLRDRDYPAAGLRRTPILDRLPAS